MAKQKSRADAYPPLAKWLADHDARLVWDVPTGDGARAICYAVGTSACIAIVHPTPKGWNLYTPAPAPGSVDGALADATTRVLNAATGAELAVQDILRAELDSAIRERDAALAVIGELEARMFASDPVTPAAPTRTIEATTERHIHPSPTRGSR